MVFFVEQSATYDARRFEPSERDVAMKKTAAGWTVIDERHGVLSYKYAFNEQGATTNCFVARMGNGQLLVVSPPYRISADALKDLVAYGEVGALMANNGFHHLGLAEWRGHFPKARVFAPTDAFARIKKKNPGAPEPEALSGLKELLGADVTVTEAPATKCGESWTTAKIEGGYAWFGSDILINLPKVDGPLPMRLMFKLTKSGPGYRVFNLTMKFTVKDKKQVLTRLAEDLRKLPPTVVVPAHGDLLSQAGLAEETQQLLAPFIA